MYYGLNRSLLMTLYSIPVTAGDVLHVLHNYVYVHGLHQKYTVVYYGLNRSRLMALYSYPAIIGAPVDQSRVSVTNTHGRALPTVRILIPSSRRTSVCPNTATQPNLGSIYDDCTTTFYITGYDILYLAVMRIH